MAGLARYARRLLKNPAPISPLILSKSGFEIIDKSQSVEEETLDWYNPHEFYYPVQLGDLFKSRYPVVGKLGYGGPSTSWLCRDLLQAFPLCSITLCASHTQYSGSIDT